MLNSYITNRLILLRFPLIVGVVFLHNYNTSVGFSYGYTAIGLTHNNWFSEFLRNLISQEIARIAVPLFFLMSGYLFFNGFVWSISLYLKKLKSRVHTLLIPFLFWNIATLLIILLGQSISVTAHYFSGKNPTIINFSGTDYLTHIFGFGFNPISYQFWFIRDLIILVLISPFIFYMLKKIPSFFIYLLFLAWFSGFWLPLDMPSSEATLFFSIGSYLAINNRSCFIFDGYAKIFFIVYVSIITVDAAFHDTFIYLNKVGILLGIVSALCFTQYLCSALKIKKALLSLSNASFFVYAAHEPLLSLMRKLTYLYIKPNSDFLVLLLYFTTPIVLITVLVLMYQKLTLTFPAFIKIISGGRA